MSVSTNRNEAIENLAEIENRVKRGFIGCVREMVRRFWAYTEETSETNTKPFDGWQ